MHRQLQELSALMQLHRLTDADFIAPGVTGSCAPVLFGGQIIGQGLAAAQATVPRARCACSLHAHFLHPGDPRVNLKFHVRNVADGLEVSTRHTVGTQDGKKVVEMFCAFQRASTGLNHQSPMPEVPDPDALEDPRVRGSHESSNSHKRYLSPAVDGYVFRTIESPSTYNDAETGSASIPNRRFWLRTCDLLPDNLAIHLCLLAYVSDFNLLHTATLEPAGVGALVAPDGMIATLSHSMWLHMPARVDDWLLHSMWSPRAFGGRALVCSHIYTKDGRLVATTSQEGLIRTFPRSQ